MLEYGQTVRSEQSSSGASNSLSNYRTADHTGCDADTISKRQAVTGFEASLTAFKDAFYNGQRRKYVRPTGIKGQVGQYFRGLLFG